MTALASRLPVSPQDKAGCGRKERFPTTLFVRHQVKDFTAWRPAYSAAATLQKRAGVLAEAVYQAEDDPNDVTVTHEFMSLAEAKARGERRGLRETMKRPASSARRRSGSRTRPSLARDRARAAV